MKLGRTEYIPQCVIVRSVGWSMQMMQLNSASLTGFVASSWFCFLIKSAWSFAILSLYSSPSSPSKSTTSTPSIFGATLSSFFRQGEAPLLGFLDMGSLISPSPLRFRPNEAGVWVDASVRSMTGALGGITRRFERRALFRRAVGILGIGSSDGEFLRSR